MVMGLLVLAAIGIDGIWTTVGTHGGGPISRRLQRMMWVAAVRIHQRSGFRFNFALSLMGAIILLATIVFWVAGDWLGWVMLFSSDPRSLTETQSHQAADLGGRMYFVAYSISTLGNGDLQPATTGWRMATSIMTVSGMASLTLAVSFILSVLQAVDGDFNLGALISGLGGTPEAIVRAGWNGRDFDGLGDDLMQLTAMVFVFVEHHLAYPVLQFFRSETARTAASLRLFALHDTLLLLDEGTAKRVRPPIVRMQALRSAFDALAHVYENEKVTRSSRDEMPPPPDLNVLRAMGVPTVTDKEFEAAIHRADETRHALYAAMLSDGWRWDDATRIAPPEA